MNAQSTKRKHTPRRPYEKPRLRAIALAADEVLGGNCKLIGGGFDVAAEPCVANNCELPGS